MKRATIITLADLIQDNISIHALVKRATSKHRILMTFGDISIHALVKRATKCWQCPYVSKTISIHALVKRATQLSTS